MSASKLIVLSWKTAEITVPMEVRYPDFYGDTYSEICIQSSAVGANTGGKIVTGIPKDFTMRNIGVMITAIRIVETYDSRPNNQLMMIIIRIIDQIINQ